MLTYKLPHQRNIWVIDITSHASIKRLMTHPWQPLSLYHL